MTADSHVFDWQKEPEGFLNWMMPTLVTALPEGMFERLSEITRGWTEVSLTIQVNGVDVPVKSFLSGIERNMTYFAQKAARDRLDDIGELNELTEELAGLRDMVQRRAHQIAAKYRLDGAQ